MSNKDPRPLPEPLEQPCFRFADEPRKRQIAISIFEELWKSREGALSVQFLQEFYDISTRKIASPLPKSVAAALKSGATEILSEDLNAGQSIAGIRIVNPFA